MTTTVLLAHGSPDPRAQLAVNEAAADLAARLGHGVTTAFLDHDERELHHTVSGLDATERVSVLPLLLSTAYHARVDVPAAVAALSREVTLLEPVGHPAVVLDNLLSRCQGPALVVAAGTRFDDERRSFAKAVADASARAGLPAVAAYATGPGPRIKDVTRPGAAAVVPWVLAPGRLLDSVVASAREHNCQTVGAGLLGEEVLRHLLAARIAAAGVDEAA